MIGFDRDPDAIQAGTTLVPDPRLTLVQDNFSQMDRVLAERGIGLARFRERQAKAQHMLRQAQHAQAQSQVQDVTEEIRKLGELHEQGILTDEEFESKKRELLAKL